MLGSHSGFQKKTKELAPKAKGMHCAIHRYTLATKTLLASLQNVLNLMIKIVNCIKSRSLNTCLFKQFCKDMSSSHEVLLFYMSVCWLSKGNILNCVFEMKNKIKSFAETQKKEFLTFFCDELWIKSLAYLATFSKVEWLQPKVTREEYKHYPTPQQSDCFLLKIAKLALQSNAKKHCHV